MITISLNSGEKTGSPKASFRINISPTKPFQVLDGFDHAGSKTVYVCGI